MVGPSKEGDAFAAFGFWRTSSRGEAAAQPWPNPNFHGFSGASLVQAARADNDVVDTCGRLHQVWLRSKLCTCWRLVLTIPATSTAQLLHRSYVKDCPLIVGWCWMLVTGQTRRDRIVVRMLLGSCASCAFAICQDLQRLPVNVGSHCWSWQMR